MRDRSVPEVPSAASASRFVTEGQKNAVFVASQNNKKLKPFLNQSKMNSKNFDASKMVKTVSEQIVFVDIVAG